MGEASARKAARADLRDAFGLDVVGLINSHADSLTDLLAAHHHEVHMRVQHVQMVQEDLNLYKAVIRDLHARVLALEIAAGLSPLSGAVALPTERELPPEAA